MNKAMTIEAEGPLLKAGPKLFVIDARHGVERRALLSWLKSQNHPADGPLDWISLPISDERKRWKLEALAAKLEREPETLVVPVRIIWRIPNFQKERAMRLRHLVFGDPRMPGPMRARSILMRDKRRAQFTTGSPATISQLHHQFEKVRDVSDVTDRLAFAGYVARQAGLVLDIAERGFRGSRYKVPRNVSVALGADSRFRKAVRDLSADSGRQESEIRREAEGYMKELIARPSPFFIDIKARLDRFMLSQGYADDVVFDRAELARLRQTMREHPTLLLFTHKTYIDGVTPTDLCYQNDLPMLHVFGGINLDFFGLGFVLRRAGTIFIRRSFEDNRVYKLVLRHYVSYLLEKRFPMTWAFEGTRSRLGKLMPPRYGLLKYVLDSAHANAVRDLHIIPVVTSFDLIRDVEEYASEQAGRVKSPESLKWFIGYLKSLREPMGRVYVDFGEPVVIPDAPDPNHRMALSRIAFDVAVKANAATPLTLTSLMCLCLLGAAPRAMTAGELRAVIRVLVEWAAVRNIRLSDDLLQQELGGVQQIVDTLVASGLFIRYDQGPDVVYAIEPARHPMASYYRNTIIHHFLDKAIIELALFRAREEAPGNVTELFWEETERLRDLFKFEFFYPEKEQYRQNLIAELDRTDADWAMKLQQGGPLLKSLSHRMQPLVGHSVFLPFVEAYTVVLEILARLGPGETIAKQDCIAQALKEGRQAYMLRRITSQASIGKILFENGFKLAANMGLIGAADDVTIAKRRAMLREFRRLSRRMEKSRVEVLALADKLFDS
ncbi:MAG: glycerol-3-phosphate 1-O-acyltransferase [Parasphingorhabdus sp.]|nr:glycerol-3-phosphate 1-O-acyltransferase [Parasphingorhabdus sp.]